MSGRDRGSRFILAVLSALSLALGALPAAAAGQAEQPARYIVLLRAQQVSAQSETVRSAVDLLAQAVSARPERVYTRAVQGFSAELKPGQVRALLARAEVAAIVPDLPTSVSAQTVPTGVKRIGTLSNSTANIDGVDDPLSVDVAVLDTGIDVDHPDLNVVGGYDCTGSGSYDDGNGHGTHVAGTIGARDNGSGVVGVAPGARLWAVKVFSDNGSGYVSWLICGIDWVVQRASTIEVANFSGGAGGSNTANCGQGTDPLHQAVCRLVEAGVPFIVAAGNDGRDASNTIPAAYPEAIAVGAIVDTDGQPGGLGSGTSYGNDDTRASFSNYGSVVDLYAPGVRILSTYPGGGTALMSGTSMATPHVTGAAALYLASNPGASPAQVRSWLVSSGESGSWGSQPLVNVGSSGQAPPPSDALHDVAVTGLSVPGTVTAGSAVSVQVTVRNEGTTAENARVSLTANGSAVGSTQTVSLDAGASKSLSFTWQPAAAGSVTLVATASIDATDADPADNSRQASVTVNAQSGPIRDVSLSNLRLPSSVRQGQQATIYVTVTNRGNARETVPVSLTSNPSNPAAGTLRVQVTVDPGQSKTVRFTWRTGSQTAPGSYRLTATATLAGDRNPADNSVSGTLPVMRATSVRGR
ncbi:S8 family serine peptidase [Thermomicrobiaceae bacterium CFH 74404]|uniref:S8 family serine peptidase n=1 Tax=Thermalbibacter longus TaxID=2951981 RepID=A0AA41WFI1_9BACT|nr:S8 family serine peptidase [Thermalbibacter longus]MCM8749105.1 S8 family serine peptidase [Thermalbibacter longus]